MCDRKPLCYHCMKPTMSTKAARTNELVGEGSCQTTLDYVSRSDHGRLRITFGDLCPWCRRCWIEDSESLITPKLLMSITSTRGKHDKAGERRCSDSGFGVGCRPRTIPKNLLTPIFCVHSTKHTISNFEGECPWVTWRNRMVGCSQKWTASITRLG